MISQINSSVAGNAYTQNSLGAKAPKPNATLSVKEDGTTKVQQLKESIDSGEYKLDLSALAQKMAGELL
jgi:anti-sigma28 factor (negative regulator of flagellin synthesis)